ncbi:hypothetical protein BLD25_04475 [Candidatus Gracilibacteria bacterium GN02-872]|nr:hypothetical protein BLD25_04475 [Candidatus Gracilibacteria bacterium GN02-872]
MDLSKKLENGNILKVKVITNAQKTEITGELEDGTIKLKVRAIPEKGKANSEIIEYFSKILNLNKSKIEIISGKTSKIKLLKIEK